MFAECIIRIRESSKLNYKEKCVHDMKSYLC